MTSLSTFAISHKGEYPVVSNLEYNRAFSNPQSLRESGLTGPLPFELIFLQGQNLRN
jgi:hypothetical protein